MNRNGVSTGGRDLCDYYSYRWGGVKEGGSPSNLDNIFTEKLNYVTCVNVYSDFRGSS